MLRPFVDFIYLFVLLVFVRRVLVKLQKETICVEAALEQLRLSKHNLLLACKIDGLPMTLISGALDDISDIQVQTEGQIYLKQGSTDYSYYYFVILLLSVLKLYCSWTQNLRASALWTFMNERHRWCLIIQHWTGALRWKHDTKTVTHSSRSFVGVLFWMYYVYVGPHWREWSGSWVGEAQRRCLLFGVHDHDVQSSQPESSREDQRGEGQLSGSHGW